jgi:lysyl-tRNA synthetase class 2
MPTQRSDSWIWSTASATSRLVSVFSMRSRHSPPCWRALVRRVLLGLDSLFQLERLHSFNKKFFPDWRPRYLCVERLSDLPAVALAYLRVESLLTLPARPAGRRRAGSR